MVHYWKPAAIGGVMAVMMLAMLHPRMMSGDAIAVPALIAFVGAHFALGIALFLPALLVSKFRKRLAAHRPSLRHAMTMLGTAAGTAGIIHLFMHGVTCWT